MPFHTFWTEDSMYLYCVYIQFPSSIIIRVYKCISLFETKNIKTKYFKNRQKYVKKKIMINQKHLKLITFSSKRNNIYFIRDPSSSSTFERAYVVLDKHLKQYMNVHY